MQMPMVRECQISKCAYNTDGMCHALAITIGDSTHPRCDTYCTSGAHGGDMSCVACVGACKTASCAYNESLECQAQSIRVGYCEGEIDCLTFRTT